LAARHAPADAPAAGRAVLAHQAPGGSRTFCLDLQHTVTGSQIPGEDGGCCKNVSCCRGCSQPAPQAEHAPLYPAAHGSGIGQARRILAVRCGLLCTVADSDPFTGLLPTPQTVMPERSQPIRQNREGLFASFANPPPNPHPLVCIIVCLPKPFPVADDGGGFTNRTPSRQMLQGNYPGSVFSLVSGSAITRIRLA
jgi:hypothetical protein